MDRPSVKASDRPRRESGWRNVDILRAALLVAAVYLGLLLFWKAAPLFFVLFLGVLFGLAVAQGADALERFRIPRGVGAALIVFGFLGLLVGLGIWAAPTLRQQFTELRTVLPQAVERMEGWLGELRGSVIGELLPASAAEPENLQQTLSNQLGGVTRRLFSVLSSTLALVSAVLLIVFVALYVGANPHVYYRGLLHLIPHRARPRGKEVLRAVGATLRRWLVAQLVAMVVIGAVTTAVLYFLKVPAALSLGIIAGLLEFIPMLGPILSAVPAVAVGFLDSPQKALVIALAYWGIQLLENHLLIPILMKEGVDLPPVVTLVAIALMALVFGFPGMLVAVPAFAAVMVVVKLLYVQDVVGDEVDSVGES